MSIAVPPGFLILFFLVATTLRCRHTGNRFGQGFALALAVTVALILLTVLIVG